MEGRAIARPNRWDQTHRWGRPFGFNGGPGNCPAKHRDRHHDQPPSLDASMEGRAIARPNEPREPRPLERLYRFNGGPGNCPAKPDQTGSAKKEARASMEGRAIARPNPAAPTWAPPTATLLQWRAGQLPGQTSLRELGAAPRLRCFNGGPGNCPAKPRPTRSGRRRQPSFNGGPGNCPAKPAGTGPARVPISVRQPSFNGGPGNCPAKLPQL